MNVYLGPELDRFVGKLIKSGLYQSQSEVLREALRLLKRQEQLRQIELEELRTKVREGIRDIEAGRFTDLDDTTFDRIRQNAMKKQAARRRKAG
jgi:antitoxin ParD1/3/4